MLLWLSLWLGFLDRRGKLFKLWFFMFYVFICFVRILKHAFRPFWFQNFGNNWKMKTTSIASKSKTIKKKPVRQPVRPEAAENEVKSRVSNGTTSECRLCLSVGASIDIFNSPEPLAQHIRNCCELQVRHNENMLTVFYWNMCRRLVLDSRFSCRWKKTMDYLKKSANRANRNWHFSPSSYRHAIVQTRFWLRERPRT